MFSKKIILYISVPGLALMYGIYLYRRRKAISPGKPGDSLKKVTNGKICKDQNIDYSKTNGVDKVDNVNKTPVIINNKIDTSVNFPTELCRSAPILIYSDTKLLNGIKPLKHINDDSENEDVFAKSGSLSGCSFSPSTVQLPGTPKNFQTRRCRVSDPCKKDIVKASPIFKMSNFEQESNLTNTIDEFNNNCVNKKSNNNYDNYSPINSADSSNNISASRKCLILGNSISSPEYNYQSSDENSSNNLKSPVSIATTLADKNIKYEFILPNKFIGKLYGRNKKNVNRIKSQTCTKITIKKHTFCDELRVCSIVGLQNDVYSALKLIRKILPKKQYPNLTLKHIGCQYNANRIVQLPQENYLQLNLVEGINNDVIVTTVTAEMDLLTLFIQQPLHPSHPFLSVLQKYLYRIYNEINAPLLPQFKENVICVGHIKDNWYRLQLVQIYRSYCLAKLIDYGGYIQIHKEDLRQIRQDLLSIPFQSIECSLSNLRPIGESWGIEVPQLLLKLTSNMVLQAQVVGYSKENLPEIYLFAVFGGKRVMFINKELAARNVAQWVD